MNTLDKPDIRLQNRVANILKETGFDVDTEVHFSFSGGNDDFSVDVCGIYENYLLLFECKKTFHSGSSKFNKDIEHGLFNVSKIKKNKKTQILSSRLNSITTKKLENVSEIFYCFVIEDTQGKTDTIKQKLENNMILWDKEALDYFSKSSKILGTAGKFEILSEFQIKKDVAIIYSEDALKIEQNGYELYMLGMHPSTLLELGYVYRRISSRPESYQRIISKNRLPEIAKFYKNTKNLLLANAVIIAFDDDKVVQDEVKYANGKLRFPKIFNSAWILDGQHRVYGFKDTKYSDPKYKKKEFKLPVIAFKNLPISDQSRTFVDVNYYQKKIDTTLIYDLVSEYSDLKYEMTWPSLLVKKLNQEGPLEDKIKTSQNHPARSITIAGFVRPVLFEKLLGYDSQTDAFSGPLFKAAPFDRNKPVSHITNQKALETQLDILNRFFGAVKKHARDYRSNDNIWTDYKYYGLTRFPGINALLLVLHSILLEFPDGRVDFNDLMSVINKIDFSMMSLKKLPRGYSVVNTLYQEILNAINTSNTKQFGISKL